MKAFVFTRYTGSLRETEVAEPVVSDGDVLVQIHEPARREGLIGGSQGDGPALQAVHPGRSIAGWLAYADRAASSHLVGSLRGDASLDENLPSVLTELR